MHVSRMYLAPQIRTSLHTFEIHKPPVKTFPHLVTFFRNLRPREKTPRSSDSMRFVRVVRWPSRIISSHD